MNRAPRRAAAAFVAVNVLAAALAFGVAEAYPRRALPFQGRELSSTLPSAVVDDDGTGLLRTRTMKVVGGRIVYDVVYTTYLERRRVVPGDRGVGGPVVFFGCSFMFGQDVADGETMPARFLERNGARYSAVNLAGIGEGPHQMLAALEDGRVSQVLQERASVAGVYLAFGDHVRRAAGLTAWDRRGPRYALDDEGQVVRTGSFDDSLRGRVEGRLLRSRVLERVVANWWVGGRERELYAAVVSEARRRFVETGGAPLVVLFWPRGRGRGWRADVAAMDLLRARGLTVVDLAPQLGSFDAPNGMFLIEGDGHPNAAAFRVIAQVVAGVLESGARKARQ